MTHNDDKRHGTIILRPWAHILQRIGDKLISSETVAVIEMMKSTYDADATRVLVRFHEPMEIGQGWTASKASSPFAYLPSMPL